MDALIADFLKSSLRYGKLRVLWEYRTAIRITVRPLRHSGTFAENSIFICGHPGMERGIFSVGQSASRKYEIHPQQNSMAGKSIRIQGAVIYSL